MGHTIHKDVEGKVMPSVSQIPGIFAKDMDGFEDWICRELGAHTCCTKAKRDYYQESANLGTDIHELREAYLRGDSFAEGVPEYQAKVFEPVAKFYYESGYVPLYTELSMKGQTFGGTLDGVGKFSVPFWEKERKTFWANGSPEVAYRPTVDDLWLDDLKIKSKIDKLHPLQLYGYSLLLKETKGIDVKWGLIIRREKKLDKKPEIQKKGYYLPEYKDTWDAAMKCWHFLNT